MKSSGEWKKARKESEEEIEEIKEGKEIRSGHPAISLKTYLRATYLPDSSRHKNGAIARPLCTVP